MAALSGEAFENGPQGRYGEVVAQTGLAPWMVLAVDAAHGAVREEHGAGAARAADRRLFAEVRAVAEDARQHTRAAVTEPAREAVRAASARAEAAGGEGGGGPGFGVSVHGRKRINVQRATFNSQLAIKNPLDWTFIRNAPI